MISPYYFVQANDPPKRVICLALASILVLGYRSWSFQGFLEQSLLLIYPFGPTVVPPPVEPPPLVEPPPVEPPPVEPSPVPQYPPPLPWPRSQLFPVPEFWPFWSHSRWSMKLWHQPRKDQWLPSLLHCCSCSHAKAEVLTSESPRTEAINILFSFIILPRSTVSRYQYAKVCVLHFWVIPF